MDEVLNNYQNQKQTYEKKLQDYTQELNQSFISKQEYNQKINQIDNDFKAFIGQNYLVIKEYIFKTLNFELNLYVMIKEYNAGMQLIDSRVIMNEKEFNEYNNRFTYQIKNRTFDEQTTKYLAIIQDMVSSYHLLLLKNSPPRNEVIEKPNIPISPSQPKKDKEKIKVKGWIKFLPTIIIITIIIIAIIILKIMKIM